jgi:hypothetical protein
VKLTLDGITIDVSENDASFYLRAGYKKVKEPVTNPAREKAAGGHDKKSVTNEEKEGVA